MLIKNAKKMTTFLITEACAQIADRSLLNGQKLVEIAKIEKIATFRVIQSSEFENCSEERG